uniref:E93 n=1 Tax=Blattella germanica TaxID=6973 RepID=A0A0A1HB41_BLAGE|nr:E93 [Blattella germanica]
MGRRRWKQYQDSVLRSPLRVDVEPRIQDWEPQEKCCMCDGKPFFDSATSPAASDSGSTGTSSSLRETPPHEAAPAMTTLQSVTSMAASIAAVAALSSSSGTGTTTNPLLPSQPSAMPFYPPPPHFPPWYLSPPHSHLPGRPVLADAKQDPSATPPAVVHLPASSSASEQPLDLSAKTAAVEIPSPAPPDPSLKVPSIDNKHIFKAKPRMSTVAGRRTYTEEELQAALRDIQSGKLGTRRAAVIYGIPRSTLRNKVYKLALEKERDSHLVAPAVPKVEEEDEKELSGAEEEREVEKALRKPLLSMEDLVRFSVFKDANYPDAWGGLEHSALGPYVAELLAAQKNPASTPGDKSPTSGDFLPKFPTPLLPEFVRRMMAEDKLQSFHPNGAHADEREPERPLRDQESPDPSPGMATPPSNVILKIPSFKPTSKNGVASSSGSTEPPPPLPPPPPPESSSQQLSDSCSPPVPSLVGKGIGVSLRDVIAKSISQKFQQHSELSPKLGMVPETEPPFKRGRFTPPLVAGASATSVIKHNNNNNSQADDRNAQKILPQVQSKPTGTSSGASSQSSSSGGKGTRPKRGKYRNYDRDSLIEAVRAVQRGEMSVHRAGSHFGVPHSTLEYKVKERHLMRPRKREPKPPMEDAKKKEETRHPAATLEKSKIPPKSTPKTPYTPSSSAIPSAPNGLKLPPMFDPANVPPMPYATAPPFPFWPPNPFHSLPLPPAGFSPTQDFFASQMMQRLGGGASSPAALSTSSRSPPLGKSAREMAESLYDGTGANGSFLDGIIRSSLEMGLPPGVPKEAENMSNKALLDQLCRNSRLTPLPRAAVTLIDGGASSSDEDSIKRSSSRNAFTCSRATESDASTSAVVDLSPSSNGSTVERKRHIDEEGEEETMSPSATKPEDAEFSQETNGISNDNDNNATEDTDGDNDDNDEESACDSKNITKRVDEDAAKDDKQDDAPEEEIEENEETKSKINS